MYAPLWLQTTLRRHQSAPPPTCGSAAQGVHDHVAEHVPIALTQRRAGRVAVGDGAEGVAVRHPEDAERADHHVQVDRVDPAGEHAVRVAALEDALDPLDRGAAL